MRVPHDEVEALLREAAARHVMPRFGALAAGETREKAPDDFVTIADLEAERFLAPALAALVPGSLVLGEEQAAADPRALDALAGDDPVWLIDPVDGTRNFINGNPRFGLIAALARGGEVVGGWILTPADGAFLACERGAGARVAGGPAARGPGASPRGLAVGRLPDGRRTADAAREAGLGLDRHPGSAAHAWLALAARATDFVAFTRLWPWDHAAGALAARESGGVARFPDGEAYGVRRRVGPLLAARDAGTWERLRAACAPELL